MWLERGWNGDGMGKWGLLSLVATSNQCPPLLTGRRGIRIVEAAGLAYLKRYRPQCLSHQWDNKHDPLQKGLSALPNLEQQFINTKRHQ